MNIKKIVSAATAFALSATMFAGFSVHAATQKYTTTFADAITDNAIGTAYTGWGLSGTNLNLTVADNVLTAASQNNNNSNYLSYYIDTIENVANKAYKISFTATTTTGTNTGNNASQIGVVSSDADSIAWNTSGFAAKDTSAIGMTTSETEYAVAIIIDNISNKVTWVVDNEIKATADTTVDINRFVDRTGRGKTDTFKNFTVSELEMPTMTLTEPTKMDIATESTTKTTAVTATLSDDTEITAVSSADEEIATVAYEGTTVTVTGKAIGTTTITVTAAKNGETKDAFETVTKTFNVEVENSDAQPATITVKYQDAQGNMLKADETVTEDVFIGKEYAATDAQKADFQYTKDEIEYTAKLNTEAVTTVTPSAAAAELVLKFDITENTYATTITTAPYAKAVITGTSKSGAEVNETVYSDHTGKAVANLKVSGTAAYTVTASKGGYTAANGTVTVAKGGTNSASVDMAIADSKVVFYEDFDNTGLTNSADLYGTTAVNTATMRLNNGKLQFFSNGNGSREVTMNFPTIIAPNGDYKMTFDLSGMTMSQTKSATVDWTNTISFLDENGAVIFSIVPSFNGSAASTGLKINDQVVTTDDVKNKSFKVTVDAVGTNVTVKVGDYDAVTVATTANKTIKGIKQVNNKYILADIDNLVVTKLPSLTVVTAAPDGMTAPTTTEAKLVTDGTLADTATEVDLSDVQTVYIKVENPTANTMPSVVVGDTTYAPTYKYEINSNGYFIYQFVGVDLTDAKVTYTGAADKSLPTE